MLSAIRLSSPLWYTFGRTSARGYIVQNGLMIEGKALACYFDAVASLEGLQHLLKEANGLFAVVIHRDDDIAMAVDRVRSIPLFYSATGVSDSPYLLASLPLQIDEEARRQYMASAATFPGRTLDSRVRQVAAGSLISFHHNSDNPVCEQHYYSHLCKDSETRPSSVDNLRLTMLSAFANLQTSIANRQVVVPLSGGYDSRLIACHLKRMAINNVVCFNAGVPGSSEEAVARRVAATLGFEYHFVDVSGHDVFTPSLFNDDDFRRYYRHLGGYTNFVWLFEYVAMRYLLKKSIVQPSAVVVPGHSADFLAGSHIDKGSIDNSSTPRQLARAMAYRSFEYGCDRLLYRQLLQNFEHHLQEGYTPISAYQDFIMQHRQAQQIVNSARVYEHFSLGLRLPFWDNALLLFFRTLPPSQLHSCTLYEQYLHEVFQQYGVDFPRADAKPSRPASYFRLWLRRHLPRDVVSLLSHRSDATGESLMIQPFIDELHRSGAYSQHHQPLSSNEVLRDWYLHRLLVVDAVAE